jgi:hypothetical protein
MDKHLMIKVRNVKMEIIIVKTMNIIVKKIKNVEGEYLVEKMKRSMKNKNDV